MNRLSKCFSAIRIPNDKICYSFSLIANTEQTNLAAETRAFWTSFGNYVSDFSLTLETYYTIMINLIFAIKYDNNNFMRNNDNDDIFIELNNFGSTNSEVVCVILRPDFYDKTILDIIIEVKCLFDNREIIT